MPPLKHIKIANFKTSSGSTQAIDLSYQLFGKDLHTAPIVLVNHALTGNSNICGKTGWWTDLIGKNKCIDTNHYTILAFNIPGNGFDGIEDHLIETYKDFNACDIAKIFSIGCEHLDVSQLFAIIGGSVGGGIAWELAALKPHLAKHIIPIASDWKSTDWLIANCHIQDAILNHSKEPLADARMHAMTLYRTPESLTDKFKRSKKDKTLFNVESWLNHHGKVLTNRFNLSAYKLINHILRTIDITTSKSSFLEVASQITGSIHIVTINSDLLFKPEENKDTYLKLKNKRNNVHLYEIISIHGHDAFLIEFDQLSKLLNPIFNVSKVNDSASTNNIKTTLNKG